MLWFQDLVWYYYFRLFGLFDPYQGKKATSSVEERNSFGLGGDLVYSFADVLQSHIQKEFHLCFDNFFTSVKLVSALKKNSPKEKQTRCAHCHAKTRFEKCDTGLYVHKVFQAVSHSVRHCAVPQLCQKA